MAGVALVFDVMATLIGAAVVFYAQNRGAADQHFAHRLHFDGPQIAGLQHIRPTAVGGEEVFEGPGFECGLDLTSPEALMY